MYVCQNMKKVERHCVRAYSRRPQTPYILLQPHWKINNWLSIQRYQDLLSVMNRSLWKVSLKLSPSLPLTYFCLTTCSFKVSPAIQEDDSQPIFYLFRLLYKKWFPLCFWLDSAQAFPSLCLERLGKFDRLALWNGVETCHVSETLCLVMLGGMASKDKFKGTSHYLLFNLWVPTVMPHHEQNKI